MVPLSRELRNLTSTEQYDYDLPGCTLEQTKICPLYNFKHPTLQDFNLTVFIVAGQVESLKDEEKSYNVDLVMTTDDFTGFDSKFFATYEESIKFGEELKDIIISHFKDKEISEFYEFYEEIKPIIEELGLEMH